MGEIKRRDIVKDKGLKPVLEKKKGPKLKKYKVGFFKKAWVWIDGKKFWSGVAVGIAGPLMFAPPLGTAIGYAGLGIAGIGGAHKVVKGTVKAINSDEPTTLKTIIIAILKEIVSIIIKKYQEKE